MRRTTRSPKAPYASNGYFQPIIVGGRYVACADGHFLRRRDAYYGLSLSCQVGK
jgi:hypothetical protein